MKTHAELYAQEANIEVISLGMGYFLCDKNTHKISLWQMFQTVNEAVQFVENTMHVDLKVIHNETH